MTAPVSLPCGYSFVSQQGTVLKVLCHQMATGSGLCLEREVLSAFFMREGRQMKSFFKMPSDDMPSNGYDRALHGLRRRMYESGNDDGTFGQRPAGKVC